MNTRRTFRRKVLIIFVFLLVQENSYLESQQSTVERLRIVITLNALDQEKYRDFTDHLDYLDEFSYRSKDLDSSPVLDTVLIHRALTLGGVDPDFDFMDIPNTERERSLVVSGMAEVSGTSQWDFFCQENQSELYVSDVIIPDGAFEKGLYTTKENAKKYSALSLETLKSLSVTTSSAWLVDWTTLKKTGFKDIYSCPTIEQMFKQVQAGRYDLTPQTFSGTPDLSVVSGDITLVPIPGVKLLLKGSRYFVVSKRHPDGRKVFDALQRGLKIMEKTNEIQRALRESGFLNPQVDHWKVILVGD